MQFTSSGQSMHGSMCHGVPVHRYDDMTSRPLPGMGIRLPFHVHGDCASIQLLMMFC